VAWDGSSRAFVCDRVIGVLKWLNALLGDSNEREVKKLEPIVEDIQDFEPDFEELSDEKLRDKTAEFRGRYLAGELLDSLLPEAFAAVREASKRTIGKRHYDVQMMAGVVLHQGKIAEMRTGEGKTLVATLPLYLNSLTGKGCHLVTPNDYLSRVGGGWMGPIYLALGCSVGVIAHDFSGIFDPTYLDPNSHGDPRLDHWRPVPRTEAYQADITYGTNNEFGFDYLRDNMVWDLRQRVQRPLHYAIVDEVDNILVDEARTPLIISGQGDPAADKYKLLARNVRHLVRDRDFKIEEKHRLVTLTEEGIATMERLLGVSNLYDAENFELTHYLEQSLKAQFIFHRDRDYVLYKDGQVLDARQHHPDAEIVIIDEFTGRMMIGRRYSEGLHQAIEAKENVRIQRESQTLATITFQNYFRMYEKLAGMTGTAATEREEFHKIYTLDVVTIPTHRPMVRQDQADLIFKTEAGKLSAVVDEIESAHETGRPVLVGTVSIEKSERIAQLLTKRGIKHHVLNAKYHEQEALIIAQAGRPGAVTIATNMAGRGVDIILGGNPDGLVDDFLKEMAESASEVTPEILAAARERAEAECAAAAEQIRAAGGLYVVGTERHEARRIDNQLRGRAGRQGDPGASRFFVSLEDELMRRFGGQNIAGIMDRLGLDENVPIEHNLVNKSIENAQTKVEGYNFDMRKHVVQYDDVMNKQREVIYGERNKILHSDNLRPIIVGMLDKQIDQLVDTYCGAEYNEDWDVEGLWQAVQSLIPLPEDVTPEELGRFSKDELRQALKQLAEMAYDARELAFGAEAMRVIERQLMLQTIDLLWINHLTAMDELREGIGLRAYGQKDPLVEYKSEAYKAFQSLLGEIERQVTHLIMRVQMERAAPQSPVERAVSTNRDSDEAASQPRRREPVRVEARKVGRNDLCPCGSGKKYKRCCGR
jgi:preprotein translocase subunit SecA